MDELLKAKVWTSDKFKGDDLTKLELNVMENLNEIDDFNEKKAGDHLIKG